MNEDRSQRFVDAMVSAVLRADDKELAEDAAEEGADLTASAEVLRKRFLARAAMEAAEDDTSAVRIGRYPILRRLGAGGMGVVYAAYDEALDRRLAIKVLHGRAWSDERRRERLIREAQAMAKVTHPNLITVHEVGSHETQLFIAMEFVSGPTLKQWYQERKRTWREIVAVFIQIAEGLAALHDAGLVHRDVKPANVIIGDDGRVRVLDLGLVGANRLESSDGERATLEVSSTMHDSSPSLDRLEGPLTQTGERLGTPAYMSKEQFLGQELTPASDIFAFSVVLYEALYGVHPFLADNYADLQTNVVNNRIATPPNSSAVPMWLATLVIHGLSPDPKDRPPSMRAYAAELARDPSRTRRRWLATVGVAVLAGLAGVAVARPSASQSCDGGEQAIAEIWDGSRATEIRDVLVATKQPYAEALANRITVELDTYAAQWASAHRRICEEHARGDHSDALLDARMACLHRRHQALAETISLLGQTDAKHVVHAGEMVAKLPRLEACDDLAALSSQSTSRSLSANQITAIEALEEKLVRVAVLTNGAQNHDAIELARAVAAEAESLDYPPLLAEALLAEVRASIVLPDPSVAAPAVERAITLAITEELDTPAAEAMIRRIFLRALGSGGSEVALADLALAEAMLVRSGHDGELQALLENNAGNVYLAAGDPERARAAFERSLAIKERLYGEDHFEVAIGLGNLAILTSDEQARRELQRRSIQIYERKLGPEHPRTLDARFVAAMQTPDPQVSGEELAEVCPRLLAIDPVLAGECEFEQGRLEYARGRLADGRRVLESAREHLPADDDRRVLLDAYLALEIPNDHVIAELRERIAAADELGDDWWVVLAQAEHRLLLTWLLPDPPANVQLLERVIVDLERIGDQGSASERARLLALARGTLARNLAATGKYDRAAALATEARRFYERWARAYAARLDELDALSTRKK